MRQPANNPTKTSQVNALQYHFEPLNCTDTGHLAAATPNESTIWDSCVRFMYQVYSWILHLREREKEKKMIQCIDRRTWPIFQSTKWIWAQICEHTHTHTYSFIPKLAPYLCSIQYYKRSTFTSKSAGEWNKMVAQLKANILNANYQHFVIWANFDALPYVPSAYNAHIPKLAMQIFDKRHTKNVYLFFALDVATAAAGRLSILNISIAPHKAFLHCLCGVYLLGRQSHCLPLVMHHRLNG